MGWMCLREMEPPSTAEVEWKVVRNCDVMGNRGMCEHWKLHDSMLDDPRLGEDALESEGIPSGGVNCYPGIPGGTCHSDAYIFVDLVSDAWGCLRRQISNCPGTRRIFLIGNWKSLKPFNTPSGKKWFDGASSHMPNLELVLASEPNSYGAGKQSARIFPYW